MSCCLKKHAKKTVVLTPLTTLTPLTPNKYETKRFSPTVLPRQDSGGSRAVTPPMD